MVVNIIMNIITSKKTAQKLNDKYQMLFYEVDNICC